MDRRLDLNKLKNRPKIEMSSKDTLRDVISFVCGNLPLNNNKNEYPIYMTKEELEAMSVLLSMAEVYTWDLYDKKETDKFYNQHKENMDKIKEYHNKGHQGILAVGYFIAEKCDKKLKDIK